MKRFVALLFAILLIAALATTAYADNPYSLYAKEDNVKIYEKGSTKAKVKDKLMKKDSFVVEKISNSGKWYYGRIEDKHNDGQLYGWVQVKYLVEHIWGKWKVLPGDEATCTKAGKQTRTCTINGCDEIQTKKINATGHNWTNWKVTKGKEPTCAKEGEEYRTCKNKGCDAKETRVAKKTNDHTWDKWKVTREATCTKEGEKVRTCKVCKKEQTQTIEKAAHTWGSWEETVEPTCTEEGKKVRTCEVCDKEQTQAVQMLPHEYGEWQVAQEASCTSKGMRYRECVNCGHQETAEIEMLPHDYGEWQDIVPATDCSSGTRQRVCQGCGLIEKVDYDPEGTLRRGDRGEAVRAFQQQLADAGYSVGTPDGVFGGGTERAVMQFQMDQNLNPDGIVWPQTLKRMNHDFGPWTVVTPVARTADGERARVCRDCGKEEREPIKAAPTVERQQRGEDVRAIQQLLNDLGYNAGSADGIYGQKLDGAYAAFAADKGLTFAPGKLMPADIDALVNAWIAAQTAWMGEGSEGQPVDLALSVTPVEDAEDDTEGMTTYAWSLTNLGTERCTFRALLMGFGDGHDYTADNLALVVDGIELAPNGENSATGTVTVADAWGEGTPGFCAVAIRDGEAWQSNVRVEETDAEESIDVTAEVEEPSEEEELPEEEELLEIEDSAE